MASDEGGQLSDWPQMRQDTSRPDTEFLFTFYAVRFTFASHLNRSVKSSFSYNRDNGACMGLQIRLRHALGERVVTLRPRSSDRPLVIGRSTEADLQIPSVAVGARHCVLFVHEGKWVVQSVAGDTALNGAAVKRPMHLHVGDVYDRGRRVSATIEIDPAGVEEGRTGVPVGEVIARPAPTAGLIIPASSPEIAWAVRSRNSGRHRIRADARSGAASAANAGCRCNRRG